MSALSRTKGKVGERELGHIFEVAGLPYLREQDGRHQGSDFRVEQFAIEAKRRERLSLIAWHRELEAKTPQHLVPVVAYRPSREPWRASLLLTDFCELAREANA